MNDMEYYFEKYKSLLVFAEQIGEDIVNKIALAGLDRWKDDYLRLAKLVAFFWQRVIIIGNHGDGARKHLGNVYMRLIDKAVNEYAHEYLTGEEYQCFSATMDEEMAKVHLNAYVEEINRIDENISRLAEVLTRHNEEVRARSMDMYVDLWDDSY